MKPAAAQETARYDPNGKRRSVRKGRERGVWLFIPAVELRAAGVDPHATAPTYRVWGRRKGSILVQLYKVDA